MAKKSSAATALAPAPAPGLQEPAALPVPPKEAPGLSRYAEIGRFLLKYRNAGVFKDLNVDEKLAGASAASIPEGKPEEFVKDLEALGPTFVKIGQTLSTRSDLVPEPYIAALERMQDNVAPISFDVVREIVEAELGVRLSKLFESFEEVPLAAASLGQVHFATLRGGRQVVVKVQRPNIGQLIRNDLDVLTTSAGAVDKLTDVGRRYRFVDWVDEFRAALTSELDYQLEAENLRRFAEHLAVYERLVVPKPIADMTTQRVITMDFIKGRKVTSAPKLLRTETDLSALGQELMKAYLDQVFVHGMIHADPHPGNVFLTDDGRLALLDFGMVMHLPLQTRNQLLKLLLAIVDARGEDAAEVCITLGTRLEDFDEAEFVKQASKRIAAYAAYQDSTTATASEGQLVLELTRLGAARGLRPPSEMTLLGKTFVNLDAVLVALDPKIDVKSTVKSHLQTVTLKRFWQSVSPSQVASELIETQELIREAPKRVSSILRMLSDNRFRIHITGLEESHLMESLQKIANRITAGVICTGLLITAGMMMRIPTRFTLFGLPGVATILMMIAAVLGVNLIWSSIRGDRKVAPKEDRGPK